MMRVPAARYALCAGIPRSPYSDQLVVDVAEKADLDSDTPLGRDQVLPFPVRAEVRELTAPNPDADGSVPWEPSSAEIDDAVA